MNVNSKKDYATGALSIATAGAIGYKGVTSGIRRALGIRIEEHTTTTKNAKNIIKEGKILDPKRGGTTCSKLQSIWEEGSENFVHITGLHKDSKNAIKNRMEFDKLPIEQQTKLNKTFKVFDSPLKNPIATVYRKIQKYIYRYANNINNEMNGLDQEVLNNLDEKTCLKKNLKALANTITGNKSKTFYIGGTEKYFNKNFIPDTDDIALKTKEPLKVCKTKIGATISALKREGLSGIKQNKSRAVAGVLIATTLFAIAAKLFKNGFEKIKQNKENE